MKTPSLRALAMGLLLALPCVGMDPSPACAEDEPTAAGPRGTAWVDGWAAGAAQAKSQGKLIFLYFGRHTPT